jgi:hypothetical protein
LQEHTALFIEFSETKKTKTGVLQFANRYGLLHSVYDNLKAIAKGMSPNRVIDPAVCTADDWFRAIQEIHNAVQLWQAIEKGEIDVDYRGLKWKNRVIYLPLRVVVDAYGTVQLVDTDAIAPRARDGRLSFADTSMRQALLRNARLGFWSHMNTRLTEHSTSPQLFLTKNEDWQLAFEPADLLGAMWLQFAQVVSGNYQIRVCRGCGRPFQVGAGANRRADAITCKDSCRQKAHRQRQTL